ncbi:glycoside hydrolase family 18 protein [Hyaloscypha bicolor E]|uniref:chitinase n=1 Tax=Hyaloscypha bicolor E TaxID=1095630 RepID=A0A2J6T4T4_9HELO|nr:glycoside hydrolase family 18 protein [Hyaloscypha bicolor E]PMD58029.1 glycoside hydrolase family 18 protein [Hyaloscypha bicolor E]
MTNQFVNAVYYPSWKIYKGLAPSELQFQLITHIFYAFARINTDGTLRLLDEKADTQLTVDGEQGCFTTLAKLKRQNPHIKTLLSVAGGSGSASFPAVAASFQVRESFARTARELEHPETPAEGENFVHLLRATQAALPSPTHQLSTALPMGQYYLKNINLFEAAQELDLLNLMGYDFAGPWTEISGHQAQLFTPYGDGSPSLKKSCSNGVKYVLSRGFPANKLVLGIPAGEVDYESLPPEWVEKAQVDYALGVVYYINLQGKGFVSFDVPGTGLAGLFNWTGAGDTKGESSLVASGYKALSR